MAAARHLLSRRFSWRFSLPPISSTTTTAAFEGVPVERNNLHSPYRRGLKNGFRHEKSIFDSPSIAYHSYKHDRRQLSQAPLFFPPWATNHKLIHSKSEPSIVHDFSESESCSSSSSTLPVSTEAHDTSNQEPNPKDKALSELKRSSRHDLMMIFTCNVCKTRLVKTTCRQSYEKGVVLARCDGCNNLHLIADRLGWFGEPGSVEDLLAARGEEVKKGTTNTLNFTLEDLVGTET